MHGRRRVVYVALAVAVLALALAVPAAAKTAADKDPQGWAGGVCRGVGAVADTVAGLLGMEPDAIAQERAEGKSLSAIAEEQGVSQDKLVDTILETRGEALQQAVTDGRMSQEQADAMLERMKSRIEQRVTDPDAGSLGAGCGGPGGGASGGAGCGGAGGQGAGGCGGPAGGSATGNSI